MKREIVGHTSQRGFFRELFDKHRFPSTLLLAGPGGVGKRLVAEEIAQALFCEKQVWAGCNSCGTCLRFDAKTLTDLYRIDFSADDSGSVEQVRELLYSLQLKSFGGSNRVVIFDNVHQMSTQVGNLLLKSLEEPRPQTFFILITSNKARLLPTLLSRCQTTHFDTLTLAEMRAVLKSNLEILPQEIPAPEHELILTLSDGSFENLKSFSNELPRAHEISKRIDSIVDGDIPDATKLASEIAKDKERIGDSLRLLTILMRSKLQGDYSAAVRSRIASALQNCVSAERYILERNLSAAYILSFVFTQLLPGDALLLENVVV